MNADELDSALGRLVALAESATGRLDRLAEEVKQIRSIVEGLRYRAAAGAGAPKHPEHSAPVGATGNPTPAAQASQAPHAQQTEVTSK